MDIEEVKAKTRFVTLVRMVTTDNKPFTMIGAQIRVDALMNTDKMSIEDIEPFFKASKDLNVTTVQIPLEWKDIEIEENTWDFNYIAKILEYTNKYDLKCEFLWFGTNMCGDTHSFTVPEYILKDGKIKFSSQMETVNLRGLV